MIRPERNAPRFKPSREKVSATLEKRMLAYAAAASATGVGILALTQPAEARIVYTPAHVRLDAHTNSFYNLDLNHDGVTDFTLYHNTFQSPTSGYFSSGMTVSANSQKKSNGIVGKIISSRSCAAVLKAGEKVGPSDRFVFGALMGRAYGFTGQTAFFGPWAHKSRGVRDRYLGLKFLINGKSHYGWARIGVSGYPFTEILTGYAYETIPGKAIIAGATDGPHDDKPAASLNTRIPAPATLGALTLGTPGLAIWRREEAAVAPT